MDLFEALEKKQRNCGFEKCSEMRFFLDNSSLLNETTNFEIFKKASDSFDIIRANLIIRAIQNKKLIESSYIKIVKADTSKGDKPDPNSSSIKEAMNKVMDSLPYFEDNGTKIYIPIFSKSVNDIYLNHIEKLLVAPYKYLKKNFDAVIVDPFDYYGSRIYDSFFTRLICIDKRNGYSAYYDYDACRVYFVNPQGRLDTKICLFDIYLRNPQINHMLERLKDIVEAYYLSNKTILGEKLVEKKLISSTLINSITAKEIKKLGIDK